VLTKREDLIERFKGVQKFSAAATTQILHMNRHPVELWSTLTASERPFALIKIGDVSSRLKDGLAGYEVNERFEDESYFERLNAPDSRK